MKDSNVILATDLSEMAEVAARWTQHLAERHDLSVVVTHIISINVVNWAKGAYDVLDDTRLMRKAEKRVQSWYEEVTGARPAAVEVEVGHPTVQFEEAVARHDASLLVLSVSGKGTWKKFLVGSTVKSVASDPPCPVIVVDPEHSDFHDPPRLAVGVDFSDNSARAARFAARLARMLGSPLHLVHADRARTIEVLEEEDLPEEFVHDDLFEWAEYEMTAMVDDLEREFEGLELETHCIEAEPSRGLCEFAEERGLDMLVVGRTGHSRFVATVVGSVLLKMLQSVPTTLAVIPSDYD